MVSTITPVGHPIHAAIWPSPFVWTIAGYVVVYQGPIGAPLGDLLSIIQFFIRVVAVVVVVVVVGHKLILKVPPPSFPKRVIYIDVLSDQTQTFVVKFNGTD